MRNLYIYNACIYIHSTLLTGVDGAAGGQILSARAGYVDYLEHLVPLLKLDINILSIFHYLGSPRLLHVDFGPHEELIYVYNACMSLYLFYYNACIYIHSILCINTCVYVHACMYMFLAHSGI